MAPPVRFFRVGDRVRIITGDGTGREGMIRTATSQGVYGVECDGDSTLVRCDGTPWFPLYVDTSLILMAASA